jgi:hypothetical protein
MFPIGLVDVTFLVVESNLNVMKATLLNMNLNHKSAFITSIVMHHERSKIVVISMLILINFIDLPAQSKLSKRIVFNIVIMNI